MKRKGKFFRVANALAVPTLILLVLVSSAAMLFSELVLRSDASLKKHPGLFATVFTWNGSSVLKMSIGNFFVYLLMLAAIVFLILVCTRVKHDRNLRAKAIFLSICLFIPATIGLVGGMVEFIPHGYNTLVYSKVASLNTILLAYFIIFTFILDVVYVIFAVGVIVRALKEAALVEKGIVPAYEEEEQPQQPEQKECCHKEEREKDRAQLLEDIRKIVREELDRLDRVAIITESSEAPVEEEVVEEVEEEVEEAPAPEAEAGKIPNNPRVPFAEKIVSADKDIQERYNELKNEILAYGPSSRLSVSGDTFRLHRKAYVKITLVGKTLKVYYALNPNDYVDSPIPVADASDKSAYEDVPAMLKVRSPLSVKRAKELIDTVFANDNIEKGEVGNHNHVKDIRAELKAKK